MNLNDLVPTHLASQRWSSLSTQAEPLPALSSRWYPKHRPALDGRHLDLGTECCFGNRERDYAVDIVSLPFEEIMRPDGNNQVKVPGLPASPACVPFLRDAHAESVVDSGWNPDADRFLKPHPAAARTCFTASAQLARTTTGAAR